MTGDFCAASCRSSTVSVTGAPGDAAERERQAVSSALSATRASPREMPARKARAPSPSLTPLPPRPRSTSCSAAVDDVLHELRRERLEAVELAAADERRVDLEVRVLGGGADQRDDAVLDRRQERVLLRLVEAMDLVDEEDRARRAEGARLARALDRGAHVGGAGADRRELHEAGARLGGDEARQRRLAAAGRPEEEHAEQLAALDRRAQHRARGRRCAPARRTPPANAAACAPRAAPRPPPARHSGRRGRPWEPVYARARAPHTRAAICYYRKRCARCWS